MKKEIFIIALILFTGGCSSSKNINKGKKTDISFLESYFDKELIDCLASADSIKAFILNPDIEVKDSTLAYRGFYVVTHPAPTVLNKKQSQKLSKIVFNKNYYYHEKYFKRCTFIPDIGFRFYANNGTYADILIAFYCDEWMFVKDKKYSKNSERPRKKLLSLIQEIFLDDEYFKRISGNKK
jgi:hypothetical protein